ncbi:hypothetical protein [Caldimonas brevitalea]|uniref:Uncharacterized protein n=1 Tax=Caldimonas brevitalea TaxID=413882 RepID=A0A0G3BDX7_9BURK|nr:hypothetical protein [Caldimonas brevitalea]AKJ27497.1 hypothetical protein AAW51_0806 [Caldimonas brevitalea]
MSELALPVRGTTSPRADADLGGTTVVDAGFVVRSPAAMVALVGARVSESSLIQRHERGDFGDIPDADARRNWLALASGRPVRSVYRLASGARIEVVTDPRDQMTQLSLQGVD